MIDEVTMAIATGAAGNVAAQLLSGKVDELRAWSARVFRHGTPTQQDQAAKALEADAAQLALEPADTEQVVARWTALLATFLVAHPEARGDVQRQTTGRTIVVGSQNNNGSGAFIAGDNYGNIGGGQDR